MNNLIAKTKNYSDGLPRECYFLFKMGAHQVSVACDWPDNRAVVSIQGAGASEPFPLPDQQLGKERAYELAEGFYSRWKAGKVRAS